MPRHRNILGDEFTVRTHDPEPEDAKRDDSKINIKAGGLPPFKPNEAQKILMTKARQQSARLYHHTLFTKRILPWRYRGATTGRWTGQGVSTRTYNAHQNYLTWLRKQKEKEKKLRNMKFVKDSSEATEPVVNLFLETRGDSKVVLRAKNVETGEIKSLFEYKNGTFARFGHAKMEGIKVDGAGRMIEGEI